MSEQISPESGGKRRRTLRSRLLRGTALGAVLCLALTVALGFFADRLLNSAKVRQQIQTTFTERTGGELAYREVGISYLPLPAIELRGLNLDVPGRLQVKVDHVHVYPDLSAVLKGQLVSARVELLRPEITVTLPPSPGEPPDEGGAEQKQSGANAAETVAAALAGLAGASVELSIADGQLRTTMGRTTLAGQDLDLDMAIAVPELQRGRFALTLALAVAQLKGPTCGGQLEGVQLTASGKIDGNGWQLQISRLALAAPALELAGHLHHQPEESELDLTGKNINVASVRDTVTGLAGGVPPIAVIFTYLIGGTVPEIHFVSKGGDLASLGDWANFRLAGQLADGQVAVPEIDLELEGVAGRVELAEGVLRGEDLVARLGTATGTDGTLALALDGKSDLFSLDLQVASDLAETRALLLRLVEDQDFRAQLQRIQSVEGQVAGRLLIGEQFSNLQVKVAGADFKGRLTHDALPQPLAVTGGKLDFNGQELRLEKVSGSLGGSTFSEVNGSLSWLDSLHLTLDAGPMLLVVDELFPWLKRLKGIGRHLAPIDLARGQLRPQHVQFSGIIDQPQGWRYNGKGGFGQFMVNGPALPGQLNIAGGTWHFDEQDLTIGDTAITSRDAALKGGGSIRAWRDISLNLSGTLGEQSVAWLEDKLTIPAKYRLRTPVRLADATVGWRPGKGLTFAGGLRFGDGGPEVSLLLRQGPAGLIIERLQLAQGSSETAELKYIPGKDTAEVEFSGVLSHAALAAIFPDFPKGNGRLQGDLRVQLLGGSRVTAAGTLQGTELLLPLADGSEVAAERLSLKADNGPRLQTDLANLRYKGWLIHPLRGTVEIGRDYQAAQLDNVALCGVPARGTVGRKGEVVNASLVPEGRGLDVATTYGCLTKGEVQMTGTLDVFGKIAASGRPEALVKSLNGPLTMHFANGVIKKGRAMAAILEVLNVTEVVKGRLPNLGTSGFPYISIRMQGRFRDGRLLIEEVVMDGETLDLIGSGVIDLEQGTLQVELLAAPLKTVDSVIKRIPGINYLLGGSLVTIPLSVSGRLEDPKVTVMSPSAVSKSLLGLGERTLKMPLKLIQSILPGT